MCVVEVELKAGEMSIHTDLLLHGPKADLSSRRRCDLTLRYCAADVLACLGGAAARSANTLAKGSKALIHSSDWASSRVGSDRQCRPLG